MTQPLELALLAQRALTVAISGHNAIYFATYRSRRGHRRLGALVLAFVNLALAGESLAFGLLPRLFHRASPDLTLGSQFIAASLSLAVSLTIAVLILRQRLKRR